MNRLRTFVMTAVMVCMIVALGAPAFAAEGSASASASAMSMYMWRGIRLSEGVVVQPSIDFNYGSFNANLWVNYDGDPDPTVWPNDGGVVTETDLTLAYALPIEGVDVTVGYIYYSVLGFDTQEAFVSASTELGPVAPYINAYLDYDEGTGAYVQVGADFGMELNEATSVTVGGYVSYLADNNVTGLDASGLEYSAMHNAEVYASVAYAMGDVSIEPSVAYSFPLSTDAEAAMTDADGDDSHAYGGVTVSVGF